MCMLQYDRHKIKGERNTVRPPKHHETLHEGPQAAEPWRKTKKALREGKKVKI